MERLGMTHDPADDFAYPPAGQPGSVDFVLYRLAAPAGGPGAAGQTG
jgi:hypothetical protein